MTDSLFSEDHSNEDREYLSELVGEGKKYQSPEELAKSKVHADKHIEKLESELAEMRERNESTAKLQELVDQIKEAKESQPTPSTSRTQDTPGVERDELEKIVENVVTKQEKQKTATQNVESLRQELHKQLGDNYQEQVREELRKAGMSEQDFDSVARSSPTAALRIIGREASKEAPKPSQPTVPPQGVQTESYTQTAPTERTASYYRKLREQNPGLELDRNLAIQEYNDAIRLGDAFFDQ